MGLSFKHLKIGLLKEVVLSGTLDEIFDSKPFTTTFEFEGELGSFIETAPFRDPKGYKINIYFYHEGNNVYTLDFSINGDSYKAPGVIYSFKEYTILLATVAEAVTQFLQKYKPTGLQIKGTNVAKKVIKRTSAEGQKDRIYNFFISQIEDKGEYMVDKSNSDGIILMRK